MKKLFLALVFTLGFASIAHADTICTAETDCGLVAMVQVPYGGSCLAIEMGIRARATAFDAYGNLVDFHLVSCLNP